MKELDADIFTKSGIMVGLGEERNEVRNLWTTCGRRTSISLLSANILQPTKKHHPVEAFIPPEAFKAYESIAYAKGFGLVAALPLTRSSHHAGEDFERLRAKRRAART